MSTAKAGFVALAFGVFVACQSSAVEERPLVCQVAADREAYRGQTVTLEGRLTTDHHHYAGVTHDACLDDQVPFGLELPDAVGLDAMKDAAFASASCPDDPLYFTVTGVIQPYQGGGLTYLALSLSEARDVRRAPGSDCPLTMRELHERRAR